jgi:hypothetical protein
LFIKGPEECTVQIVPMSRHAEIILNHPLCSRIDRHKPDLVAFAFDTKMHDALAALQILYP